MVRGAKECIKIRKEQARWLKEGPKSGQREENEILRTAILKELETQVMKWYELLKAETGTELTSVEQRSGDSSSVGAQTNNTRYDH